LFEFDDAASAIVPLHSRIALYVKFNKLIMAFLVGIVKHFSHCILRLSYPNNWRFLKWLSRIESSVGDTKCTLLFFCH